MHINNVAEKGNKAKMKFDGGRKKTDPFKNNGLCYEDICYEKTRLLRLGSATYPVRGRCAILRFYPRAKWPKRNDDVQDIINSDAVCCGSVDLRTALSAESSRSGRFIKTETCPEQFIFGILAVEKKRLFTTNRIFNG